MRTKADYRQLAMKAQRMMELRPDGSGFRRVPEHSDQVSIVERYLIAAGEMSKPHPVPPDRRYRSVRRERIGREKRLKLVANKEMEKLQPLQTRRLAPEPTSAFIAQVSEAFKAAKNPAEFAMAMLRRVGVASMLDYDRLASRAERHLRNSRKGLRMPSHIRDKLALLRIIEGVIALRWPSAATAAQR